MANIIGLLTFLALCLYQFYHHSLWAYLWGCLFLWLLLDMVFIEPNKTDADREFEDAVLRYLNGDMSDTAFELEKVKFCADIELSDSFIHYINMHLENEELTVYLAKAIHLSNAEIRTTLHHREANQLRLFFELGQPLDTNMNDILSQIGETDISPLHLALAQRMINIVKYR